jgi:hypothetical protein
MLGEQFLRLKMFRPGGRLDLTPLRTPTALLLSLGLLLSLQACGYGKADYQTRRQGDTAPHSVDQTPPSIFGPSGLTLFGGNDNKPVEPGAGNGIAVNSYLWRASLDTISFMPLASADPFGGVIITDWYTPPEAQSERFKVTIYILGRDLRADGVRASIFRQVRGGDGTWVDTNVEPKVGTDIENAILVRARQLRIAGLQ